MLIGQESIQIVQDQIIRCTPIISKAYVYVWRQKGREDAALAVHFVTDDGQKNTVIEKLSRRAHEDFVLTYYSERPRGLKEVVWRFSGSTVSVPKSAELIYEREDPELEDLILTRELDFDIVWEEPEEELA